jgi:hypothetical protein
MNRERLARRIAALAVVLGVVLVTIWAVAGSHSEILAAIAIGAATAAVILGDTRGACSRRLLRREG